MITHDYREAFLITLWPIVQGIIIQNNNIIGRLKHVKSNEDLLDILSSYKMRYDNFIMPKSTIRAILKVQPDRIFWT